MVTIDQAIDLALAADRGPIVVAITTDNPGGGAPGDNTGFVRRLIERQVTGAAVAPIWDPMAVRILLRCRCRPSFCVALRLARPWSPRERRPMRGRVLALD